VSFGITAWGAYIPRLRLERAVIAATHAWMAPSLKGLGFAQFDLGARLLARRLPVLPSLQPAVGCATAVRSHPQL
jgi:hypothetical protein